MSDRREFDENTTNSATETRERPLRLAFGSFVCFWWVAERWRTGSCGLGDVRLSAPLCLVLGSLGPWAAPIGLYLGFAVGAVLGLTVKAREQNQGFAFGPAMLAGAIVGAVLS